MPVLSLSTQGYPVAHFRVVLGVDGMNLASFDRDGPGV
jgi:hypothetical protein